MTVLAAAAAAAAYLIALRLVDVHEREPSWALASSLALGAAGGLVLHAGAGAALLLRPLVGRFAAGAVLLLALVAAIAVLEAIERIRGWSEFQGPLDGAIHGASVGLGFAAATILAQDVTSTPLPLPVGGLELWWSAALDGAAWGLFGAAMGGALVAGLHAERPAGGVGWPVVAAALTLAPVGWWWAIDRTVVLGATGAVLRAALLFVPLLVVLLGGVLAVRHERRLLASQPFPGTEDDRRRLLSPASRARWSLRVLGAGDLSGWKRDRRRRDLQMAYLLVNARRERSRDPDRRESLQRELDALSAHLGGSA